MALYFLVVLVLALAAALPVVGAVGMNYLTLPPSVKVMAAEAQTGAITGRVLDAAGQGIAGLGVGAGDYDSILTCGPATFWTTTAADGSYRLQVSPGNYLVFVNSHSDARAYLPAAYRDVRSWGQIAQTPSVSVATGQTIANVDLHLATGLTLRGRLVNAQCQPVRGAGGHIQDATGAVEYGCALGFGSSDSDGTFQVHVPSGVYDLFFGLGAEDHTVRYGLIVTQALNLGDVLFAEGAYPSVPRALQPGYTTEWFVAPGVFNMPQEVLLASDGGLWVLAVRSQQLYHMSASGVVTPAVGDVAAYLGDVDVVGNLYLHGHPQGIIYRISPDGATKTVMAQSSELQSACDSGFGIGPDGNLYLARNRCAGISTLLRITPGGVVTRLADGLPPITALRTAPDGRFLAAANNRVYVLSLQTYALTLLGEIPGCCIAPGGLTVDDSHNIYVSTGARSSDGQVYRIGPDGRTSLLAHIALNGLSGLEWLAATREVVGGQLRQGAVLAVDARGGVRQLVPGNGLVSPMGMAFAPDGTLAVANDDGGMMTRISPQADVTWFFDYVSFTPPMPFVGYASDGALYASEGAPGFVGRIVRLLAGAASPAPWVNLDWPSGLAREANGTWLVSETKAGRITRVQPNGATSSVATDLDFPQALALDAAGQLYAVTGSAGDRLDETFPVPSTGDTLVRITPDGQSVTVAPVVHAAALVVAADGSLFTVARNRVLHITPQGQVSVFADGFVQAMGLAFDVYGDLYVSDAALNGLARISGFAQGTVQGRAHLANGAPVIGAHVQVLSDWPIVIGAITTTDSNGAFHMLAAPRTYTVTVTTSDGCSLAQRVTVSAGTTQTLDLVFHACFRAYLPLLRRPGQSVVTASAIPAWNFPTPK